MEKMDSEQAKRVWSRVLAAEDAQPQQTSAEDFSQKVLAAMAAQKEDLLLYRFLQRRLCPSASAQLKALAEHTECRMKTLGAIYYLETDRKACVQREKQPCVACANEALRQQYARVSAQEARYRALGEENGAYSCEMQQLAGLLCCDKKLLLELLKENL